MKRLLLISSSTVHGSGYLDHCGPEIASLLGEVRRVLFIPFALKDREAYTARAAERLAKLSYSVEGLDRARDPQEAVARAEAIFIGGGNTFRLLDALYRQDLLQPIRDRVLAGAPYIGSSAGSNVACPTIKTTNDMPIVYPVSLAALGLVPFNINPHFLDADPRSTHQGETRETRIREFHEENDPVVVGLREGAMLRVEGARVTLRGTAGARVFVKGRDPREFAPGESLDFLLA
jgi:dipeptidase E